MSTLPGIKRKRVTRVGSGAFSIYLPKKWIDSWPAAQQESREVDLHLINDSLMIVPAHLDLGTSLTREDSTASVCQSLQSAYVRGFDHIDLHPPQGQTYRAETIASARDMLRHLDERLIVTSTPERIGFSLDPDLPPNFTNGQDLLRILTSKIRDMVDLCGEAVDSHLEDTDRSLHAMALLATTQREDVQRLFHQALRVVSRIELPMRSVSDFQVLDLLAADLERFGSHLVRIVEILLGELGLTLEDLSYPRPHLIKNLKDIPARSPLVQELIRNGRLSFETISATLATTFDAIHDRDIHALTVLKEEIMKTQDTLANRFFATITEHWGDDMKAQDAMGAFAMTRIASILADLAHVLQSACHHAIVLLAAEPGEATV